MKTGLANFSFCLSLWDLQKGRERGDWKEGAQTDSWPEMRGGWELCVCLFLDGWHYVIVCRWFFSIESQSRRPICCALHPINSVGDCSSWQKVSTGRASCGSKTEFIQVEREGSNIIPLQTLKEILPFYWTSLEIFSLQHPFSTRVLWKP